MLNFKRRYPPSFLSLHRFSNAVTLTKALPLFREGLRGRGFKGKDAVKVNDRETTAGGENEIFAVLAMTSA
jgi:hypothetical protein